jgi:hypothetical protein
VGQEEGGEQRQQVIHEGVRSSSLRRSEMMGLCALWEIK